LPYYPSEKIRQTYKVDTIDYKIVIDYANVSYFDTLEMDMYTFYSLLKDAFIYNCQNTEKGKEYLENAWILEQKKPSRGELRNHFRKE